jgi:hypothetical protein
MDGYKSHPNEEGKKTMLTQAIKRWLNKLFGWWPWKNSSEPEYTHVVSPLNKGVSQESVLRSTSDGATPQSGAGAAPQIVGQGETSCSTIDEWPERVMQPPPPASIEKAELPPAPLPTTSPLETARTSQEDIPTAKRKGETLFPDAPPPTPTPEQQLEFLHYLVKRGIVNEGFAEGNVPEQYRN